MDAAPPPSLNHLPDELLLHIVSALEGRGKTQSSLRSLCLVSRRFLAIAEPSLYSSFHDRAKRLPPPEQTANEFRYRSLLHTILERPKLTYHVKHATVGPWNTTRAQSTTSPRKPTHAQLQLFLAAACHLGLDTIVSSRSRDYRQPHVEGAPRKRAWTGELMEGIAEAELFLLLHCLPRLESVALHVPSRPASFWNGTRISRTHKNLRTVKILVDQDEHGESHSFGFRSLHEIFALPALQSLTLENLCCEDDLVDELPPCNLKYLHLSNCRLYYNTLAKIIDSPTALETFRYDRNPLEDDHIFIEGMFRLLMEKKSTLQKLHIHMDKRGAREIVTDQHSDPLPSLSSFEKLTDLFLDLWIFHATSYLPLHELDENAIVDFLPPNIRFLRIVNEDHTCQRALTTLEQVREMRFPQLEKIANRGGFRIVSLTSTPRIRPQLTGGSSVLPMGMIFQKSLIQTHFQMIWIWTPI
jgi:hypothetical protein